jgi:predicted nucleic acid-binding protein
VNLVEVVDFLVRRRGIDVNDVRRVLAQLPVSSVAVDEATALRGGELRAAHYRAGTCEVSLADCVLAATAGAQDQAATSDPHLPGLLRAEGIGIVALPDSRGARP